MAVGRDELELEKLRAEILKVCSETEKIDAEMRKLTLERYMYPLVVGSGMTLAVVGVVKLFH